MSAFSSLIIRLYKFSALADRVKIARKAQGPDILPSVQHILNCGNVIKSIERVKALRERLEDLKNMSEDDIKAFYKQKLRAEQEEGSKGAGVGLIEIARKSSEFDFDFIDLNDGTSFFLLRSILK